MKLLWQDELNPRVRCAFGNVDSYDHPPYYCAHFGYRQNDQSNHAKKLTTVHLKMITSFCESQMLRSDGYFIVIVQIIKWEPCTKVF